MSDQPRSLGELIRSRDAAQPDATAIRYEGDAVTWGRLAERSRAFASALTASGVGSQEHVAFLDKNCLEYFEFTFGAGMANAINVSINWRLAPPEIAFTVNDSTAKVLIVGQEFFEAIEAIESDLDTVTTIVAIGDHPRWVHYDDWLGAQPAVDPGTASELTDVGLQLYTSGTTGLPKGVMLSNANLFTLLDGVGEPWGFYDGAVNLVCMPLFHIGGVGWAIAGMYGGCTSVLVREFVPDKILDTIVDEGITTALFVPAMLQFMALVPGAVEREYPIRTVVYGAAPITDETLLAAMNMFDADFIQVYGMTESTGAFTALPPEDHDPGGPRAHLLRSAGKASDWVELKVMDLDAGHECAPGEVGEVWQRSTQTMVGYWNRPDATAEAVTDDGWLRTGDAGYLDEEGYLFLTDRVKDMIVSGGENVYPIEVENVLDSHPAVVESGVIGVPSERWGETVKAIVVVKPDHQVTAAELMSFAKERLAGYKCPTSVDFIDALPRNPSGKILKKDLRAPFWEGRERAIN